MRKNGILIFGDSSVDATYAQFATAGTGWGKGFNSMLSIQSPQTLASGSSLAVGTAVAGPGEIVFGSQSLLMVNASAAAGENAALDGSGNLVAETGAKLYIANANAGTRYHLFKGFDYEIDATAWRDTNLLNNRLVVGEATYDGDSLILAFTPKEDVASLYPVAIQNAVSHMAENQLVDNDSPAAVVRFLSRAMDPLYLEDGAVVAVIDSGAQIAYAGGVQTSTFAVTQAASKAVQDRLAQPPEVDKGNGLWAKALYGDNHVQGLGAGALKIGNRSQFGGLMVGLDGSLAGASGVWRGGAAIDAGSGSARSRQDFSHTKNDYDFWGATLYGSWTAGQADILGEWRYSQVRNDIDQSVPSSLGLDGKLKADVDSKVIRAGLTGQYRLDNGSFWFTPYAGFRFTSLWLDGFDTKLKGDRVFHTDRSRQNIWQFPVGLRAGTVFGTASGWRWKPKVDVALVPVAGDRSARFDVAMAGWSVTDRLDRPVMDDFYVDATFGVTAEKDNFLFSLNMGVQSSSHQTWQGLQAEVGYRF